MIPTLPQSDPYPSARASRMHRELDRYRYRYDYPAGVPLAKEVPQEDRFSAGIALQLGRARAALVANRAAARVMEGAARATASAAMSAYRRLFSTIPPPPLARLWCQDMRTQDLAFGWQRIAGGNPLSLRRLDVLPAELGLSEAELTRALGADSRDSLAAALAEGRLFYIDYRFFHGTRGGAGFGARKELPAPLALFLQHRGGELLPLAILPALGAPLATPADGHRWCLARIAFQVADAHWHELGLHLGHTHFVAEGLALAMRRRLDVQHPLRVLLDPHFEHTLAINRIICSELLMPGGEVETLLAPDLESSLAIVARARKEFSLIESLPRRELAARGVSSAESLPNYPYRDDGLLIWDAIVEFVRAYLAIYYKTVAELHADHELRAFFDELRSAEGARMSGVPELTTIDSLVEVIAYVIWLVSAQHAALNYSQFDAMAYTPGAPLAAYGPTAGLADADADAVVTALGPLSAARAQLAFCYQQSRLRENTLGDYPAKHWHDARVQGPLRRLRQRLAAIEDEIAAREPGRLAPYSWLRPSRLPASIHV